ncbi:M15 family metallopeptidase [Paraoerskovia sediminicola]|uniref:M15 family metallopeptidase n=1 Tax=Paraoerskovia sediminicola TaxID=1138587 RepID=UPI0025729620|nr:M15 family metallopeptidase [Paraoerskovia sediminicola]
MEAPPAFVVGGSLLPEPVFAVGFFTAQGLGVGATAPGQVTGSGSSPEVADVGGQGLETRMDRARVDSLMEASASALAAEPGSDLSLLARARSELAMLLATYDAQERVANDGRTGDPTWDVLAEGADPLLPRVDGLDEQDRPEESGRLGAGDPTEPVPGVAGTGGSEGTEVDATVVVDAAEVDAPEVDGTEAGATEVVDAADPGTLDRADTADPGTPGRADGTNADVAQHEHDGVEWPTVVDAAWRVAYLLDSDGAAAPVTVSPKIDDEYIAELLEHEGASVFAPFVDGRSGDLVDDAAVASLERDTYLEMFAGMRNGRIPASALCALPFAPGHSLRCDAAAHLIALSAAYEAEFGVPIPMTDSYRSYASQVAVRAAKPHLAAVPGTSQHGWGLAVDLSNPISGGRSAEYRWLRLNAPDYGWGNPTWARPGAPSRSPGTSSSSAVRHRESTATSTRRSPPTGSRADGPELRQGVRGPRVPAPRRRPARQVTGPGRAARRRRRAGRRTRPRTRRRTPPRAGRRTVRSLQRRLAPRPHRPRPPPRSR